MIFVVFATKAEFDAFKAAFPSTLADPDTLLGEAYPEEADANGVPLPGTNWIVAHHFTADEAAVIQMAAGFGVDANVRVGDPDGPEFGSEEAAP